MTTSKGHGKGTNGSAYSHLQEQPGWLVALIAAVVALLALSPRLTPLAGVAATIIIVVAVLLAVTMTLATCNAVCDHKSHRRFAICLSGVALFLLMLAAVFATMVFVVMAGLVVSGLAALVNSQVAGRPRRSVRVTAFTFAVSGALAFSMAAGTLAAVATVAISTVEGHGGQSDDGPTTTGPTSSTIGTPPATFVATTTGTSPTSGTSVPSPTGTDDLVPPSSSTPTTSSPSPPTDCGADPWVGADYSPTGFVIDAEVAAAVVERLRQLPFVYGGCPSNVEAMPAGLIGVTTACRAYWPTCSVKLLVTSPTMPTAVVVYELDIEPTTPALRSGRVVAMTERTFDGHTWWYDLLLDATGKTCLTYISSFDRVGLVMEPSMQYLVKDLMVRLDTILEPTRIQVDDATGEVNVRLRPSMPGNQDGFIDVRMMADGGSKVVAASLRDVVGLSAASGQSCRQSAELTQLAAAPHDPLRGPRLVD